MIDIAKLKEEQIKLSKKIELRDDFSDFNTVAGCDVVYAKNKVISVIVVCDAKTFKVREQKYSISNINFPYIPGFLSYREASPTVETYHKLEIDPDVMIIDGNGILHPRKMGIACHVGLLTGKATIGVSKNLLCGDQKNDTIYIDKEAVAKVLETKEKAKPVYVSPGHMITLRTAVEIVKNSLQEHKLPEPLHLAHKYAAKLKRKMKEDNNGSVQQ